MDRNDLSSNLLKINGVSIQNRKSATNTTSGGIIYFSVYPVCLQGNINAHCMFYVSPD